MDPSPDSPQRDSPPPNTRRARAGTAANGLPFGLIGLGFLLLIGGAAVFSYDLSSRLDTALQQLDQARAADAQGRDLLGSIEELRWIGERLQYAAGPVEIAGYISALQALQRELDKLRQQLHLARQQQPLADQAAVLLARQLAAATAAGDDGRRPSAIDPALRERFAGLADALREVLQEQQRLSHRLIDSRTWSVYVTLSLIAALGLLTTVLGARHFDALRLQEQLRAEVARSQRQNDDKSRFLTHVSHEIRAPMNAIFGYAGLLHGRLQDPQQRRCVESITRSARTLLVMIDELLDLSKIEAGHLELDRRPTQLRDLVDGVVELFAGQAAERGLTLRSELPAAPPDLLLDGERLRQMLVNLVGNALKHTAEGEICIRVQLRPDAAQPVCGDCLIEVADSGCGIAEAELQAIFEPYRRGGGEAHGGTGLGLFITRQIARLMGGEVSVSSAPGQGSVFRISLPRVPLLAASPQAHAEPAPPSAATAMLQPEVVLPRLTALLHEAWPQLRDSLTIGDARRFAEELAALAGRGGGAQLQRYARRLRGAADDFDVAAIERLLAEYPAEVLALRRLQQQAAGAEAAHAA